MSDTGLFSGIYQGIRDHADLLDRVLVRLKAGTSHWQDDDRQRLSAWLNTLGESHTVDSSASMIRILLRGQGVSIQQGWGEIATSLQSEQVSAAVIGRLEVLARALEREQSAALTRLRGEG